jgi:hypothetical protein
LPSLTGVNQMMPGLFRSAHSRYSWPFAPTYLRIAVQDGPWLEVR